jgi:photosystem II stability/assembly factor-like uncharacterized protein
MTPEDNQLRRALDARSSPPSANFQARLESVLEAGRPRPNLTPAIAIVTVLAISIGSIGALIAARHNRPVATIASGARLSSPSPSPEIYLPGNAQVVAPSPGVVWVLVDYQALFRSTDQGNTWEPRPLPSVHDPMASFIDGREGWVLDRGVPVTQCDTASAWIWHTVDGGASWTKLNVSGIADQQCKENIWFVDSRMGFITAWDDNRRPTIYRTTDGGLTWSGSALPDPPDFTTQAGGFTLRADWVKRFGTTLYLEAWWQDRQYVFSSGDGGASWIWLTKIPASVVMVTETRWLALTGPGPMQETINGGQQWHPYSTDLNIDSPVLGGTQIVFADAQTGYETGRGALQRSDDGGAHWVRIPTPGVATNPSPTPSGIPLPTTAVLSAPSTNVVWALVANEYLFRSTDQGKTWQQRSTAPRQGGDGDPMISFLDDMTGWVLFPGVAATNCTSQSAQLWHTTDGAKTWQVLANDLPFDQCKDAMYFADSQHGFVATSDFVSSPKVWRTSDGGLKWLSSPLPDPRANPAYGPAVQMLSVKSFGSTVLTLGWDMSAGYIFRSTDGGVTWANIATVSPAPGDLAFVTATRWIGMIASAPAQETLDSGKSWHAFATDYQQAAGVWPHVVFGDPNVGYATVRGGIQLTQDGGAHWVYLKTPGAQQPG